MTAQLSREDVEAFIKQVESDVASGWEAQVFELKLAKRVLAGMNSEPVAWVARDDLTDKAIISTPAYRSLEDAEERTVFDLAPLYAAPPAPVAVPDDIRNRLKAEGVAEVLKDATEYAPLTAGQWETLTNNWHQTFLGLSGDENACRAAMLKAGAVTGWIKCSERMPENDDSVLILTGYMQTAYWCAEENEWYWGDESWFPDQVTHWMQLPAAPEQEV